MLGVGVRNVIYSLPNERKVSIKTELVFRYVIREMANVDLIKGINEPDNIEYKETQDVFYNVLSTGNEIVDVREDIVLPSDIPNISEILRVNSGIINTEYKVSYNKILVKGDIRTEINYIENEESSNIHTYVIQVPFTGMIEFDNISENSKFDIKYNLRNLELTVSNLESNMLTISAEVMVEAIMYEEKVVTYINDFYSTSKELRFDVSNVAIIKNKTKVEKQIALKENLGPVEAGNRIVNYITDTEHLTTKVSGGNLYVDGPIKVNVIFINNETGSVENKSYDVLVNSTIPLGVEIDEENVSVEITPLKQEVVLSNGNVEANIILGVNIELENMDKVTVIGDIEETDIDDNNFDSMYIYIIKKGDNLWSIAKKYKTTVAKIANINNIPDENKIDIGQKILIIR